ncbi:hypothetical protein AB3G45_10630 [Shinella sp. S4-D37]|uniref:hypothetical protein n=1 Tax=Shinella sp. S4-D37 TaxID=3161999 RepID=UPI003467165A
MGGNQHTEGSESLPTQGDAARMLNVSDRSIRTAKQVQENGTSELVHAVETGKVSVSAAAVIAKQDEDTQRRLVAEDKLKRAAPNLKRAEAEAKEAAKLPKAESLTTEQKIEKLTQINAREKRCDRMGTSKQEVSNAGFRHFRYFVRFCSFLRGARVRDHHFPGAEISRPRHSGIGWQGGVHFDDGKVSDQSLISLGSAAITEASTSLARSWRILRTVFLITSPSAAVRCGSFCRNLVGKPRNAAFTWFPNAVQFSVTSCKVKISPSI